MPDPTSYTPAPANANPNPNLISKTRQDLSAGLLEASFGILGETFASDAGNPNLAIPYAKLGATISGALHDRWHKQEYENFQAQYVRSYQQAANAIQGNLQLQMSSLDRGELIQPDGSITKIDPKSEGFLRTKDTVIRQSMQSIHKINDQFLQDAAKFATNPYISNVAQNLMQSTASLVSEASGPTAAAETEKGYAEQDTERAQKRYLDRLPQASGSGSEKEDKRGDPQRMLEEMGPDGFLGFLVGHPKGRDWTEPYQTTAAGDIERELIEADPDLADDPEQLARRMKGNEKLIQERAAGLYMMTVFPGHANRMSKIKGYGRFFPQEEEPQGIPKIDKRMTTEETKNALGTVEEATLSKIEEFARDSDVEDFGTVKKSIMEWLEDYLDEQTENNKAGKEFRAKAIKHIKEFLADEDKWGKIPIARERFGKPKKGIFDRIREEVTKKPGTVVPRSEYSGKGGLGGKPAPGYKPTSKGLF